MSERPAEELYADYVASLSHCTPEILAGPDDVMLCNLLEDGFTSAWSFLYEASLAKLRNARFIDDEMVNVSKDVRMRWVRLEQVAHQKQLTAAEIRNDDD